ncbi:MAG: prepilin peptidase [Eubacteriales bacterium]
MQYIIPIVIAILLTSFTYEVNNYKKSKKIFVVSMLVGVCMGLSILRLYALYDLTYYFLMSALIITFLSICSIKDIKEKLVPINYIIITFCLGLIMIYFNPNITLKDALFGVSIGLAFNLLGFITKNSIGQGDGLVISVVGVVLGWQMTIAILLYGLVFSGLYGGFLLIFIKKNRKTKIPFIPFLLLATGLIYLI